METKTYKHQFWFDKKLHRENASGRKNIFVIVPEKPTIPTRHPGVDGSENANRPIAIDHQELIHLGESTIQFLKNTKKKSAVCPRVLFLMSKQEEKIYQGHMLKNYMKTIISEKQRDLELHIAAHGDQNKIGSSSIGTVDCELRYDIDTFAEVFDMFLSLHAGESFKDIQKRPINIVFHSCNSAYADITENMSQGERDHIIRTESLIGKFASKMKKFGFTQLTVSGFRGYYSHLTNKKASVVSSTLDKHSHTEDANKAKFTIHPYGKVTVPAKAYFPVEFKEVNVTRLHQPSESVPKAKL